MKHEARTGTAFAEMTSNGAPTAARPRVLEEREMIPVEYAPVRRPACRAKRRCAAILLSVDGEQHYLEVMPGVTLLQLLCDDLHLARDARCCASGHCGACDVLVDGVRTRSCATSAASLDGAEVVTLGACGADLPGHARAGIGIVGGRSWGVGSAGSSR
jgi:hypothetical protein